MAKKLTAFLIATVIYWPLLNTVAAQTHLLPANQPEQDACGALSLCGTKFYTPYSYQGQGLVEDLVETPCGSGEDNSMWMKIQVATAGTIIFTITPVDPVDDYDFAVVDATGVQCSNLSSANVVRCNFNNNYAGSNVGGVVGLNMTSTIPFVQSGVTGMSFCQYISATPGQTYLVMVNNFGHDDDPGPSKGFTIDFSGSTASFVQPPPPAFASANTPLCANNSADLVLQLTKQVLCSSIATNGSDFSISPSVKVASALGVNCTGASGYTTTIDIGITSPPAGTYMLVPQTGTDGNTLVDLCGNQLLLTSPGVSFTVLPPITGVDSESICYSQLPYTWHNQQVNQGGTNAATFIAIAADGCDSTITLNLTVSSPPATASATQLICSGQQYTLPWNDSAVTTPGVYAHTYPNTAGCDSLTSTITISYDNQSKSIARVICSDSSQVLTLGPNYSNYQWGTGATTPAISISGPGSYTVVADDSLGCPASDTFNVSTDTITAAVNGNIPLCQGTTLVITASSGFTAYLWSDGSTQQTFTTSSPGIYWVTVTDKYNCQATDTAVVVGVPLPANFLTGAITKCFYSTVVLRSGNTYNQYLWGTGDTTASISIINPGYYTLTVTDSNGCVATDSINVIDSACAEYLYMPTAFSPNGDGINDTFKPGFAGLATQFSLIIYNRWGQKVFASSNPATGWDGTVNGQQEPPGVYVWQCQYQLYQQQPVVQKGTVVLIR